MPGFTPSTSDTPRKKPSPSNAWSRPSTTTDAPSALAASRYDATRSQCARVINGPISASGSDAGPMRSLGTRAAIASTKGSATSPTATSTEIAMQRSPADPYAADTAASAATSTSASGSTIMWFFAPPSACTRFPLLVPVVYTWRAIGVEPTKLTASTPGWVSKPSTATASPCTTLKTPSGTPASVSSSASRIDVEGSFSLGFNTNVLPHAIAVASIHNGTITGKLNGVMPTTTPSGCRTECTSMSVDACWE